jgi:hypothetical protein
MYPSSNTDNYRSPELTGLIEPLAAMIASADDPVSMRATLINEIQAEVTEIDRHASCFIQKKMAEDSRLPCSPPLCEEFPPVDVPGNSSTPC